MITGSQDYGSGGRKRLETPPCSPAIEAHLGKAFAKVFGDSEAVAGVRRSSRLRERRTLRLEPRNAEFLAACAERDDGSQNYLINMLLASAREAGVTSIIELAIDIRGGRT
jgi:hypothetical protein